MTKAATNQRGFEEEADGFDGDGVQDVQFVFGDVTNRVANDADQALAYRRSMKYSWASPEILTSVIVFVIICETTMVFLILPASLT